MSHVGASIGVLYKLDHSTIGRLEKTIAQEVDCIEIGFGYDYQIMRFNPYAAKKLIPENVSHVSIHAPFRNIQYDGKSFHVLTKLMEIVDVLDVEGVVMHPNIIDESMWSILEYIELPILIENMDIVGKFGTTLNDFVQIKKEFSTFNYAFDIFHAYQNDKTMTYARDLIKILDSKIKEIHVSGKIESPIERRHAPLHISKNPEIIKLLSELKSVPWLSEAIIRDLPEFKRELDFLKTLNSSN